MLIIPSKYEGIVEDIAYEVTEGSAFISYLDGAIKIECELEEHTRAIIEALAEEERNNEL